MSRYRVFGRSDIGKSSQCLPLSVISSRWFPIENYLTLKAVIDLFANEIFRRNGIPQESFASDGVGIF